MTSHSSCAARGTPSPWITRWSHLVRPGASVLDVACGAGRHLSWFADRGYACTGIDRDISKAQDLADKVTLHSADIENASWPLLTDGVPQQFDSIVVANYLWRPLIPTLLQSLAPGGVLLYETFAQGNETVGRPARPEFLLRRGELLQICQGLCIVAFEDGYLDHPARYVQRVVAVREAVGPQTTPALYTL